MWAKVYPSFLSPLQKWWSCSSKNHCIVMSLTVSVLLLLPVLNKKYIKLDVSENSTVGCLICASGRLMRVTNLKPKSKCLSPSGQKTQQWWTGTQHAAIAPTPLCSRWPQSGELSVALLGPFCWHLRWVSVRQSAGKASVSPDCLLQWKAKPSALKYHEMLLSVTKLNILKVEIICFFPFSGATVHQAEANVF